MLCNEITLTFALIAPANEEEDAEDQDVFVPSGIVRNRSFGTFKHEFKLTDATDFIITGTEVSICIDRGTHMCGHIVSHTISISLHAWLLVSVHVCADCFRHWRSFTASEQNLPQVKGCMLT